MINVTKTYLPPFEEYTAMLKRAWDKAWITNNGELVQELEAELKKQLSLKNLLFTSNGTIVLQMALKAFDIKREVITTPFSYVATTTALLWEKCTPVFVDIDSNSLCIDADKIEMAITENTEAILATHVYGIPCNVEKIEAIATKYGLKVIYDGAHAFGSIYKNKSLLNYGDISTCSFHATKLFHTVEGGCIICKDQEIFEKLFLYRQFGHKYDDYIEMGINAKNSEFHAAMGLCLLPYMSSIIAEREYISNLYDSYLLEYFQRPIYKEADFSYNYAYYPIIFPSEKKLLIAMELLKKININSRRYFYPSLNNLTFLPKSFSCPISENISKRVLCLPLYPGLKEESVCQISNEIIKALNEV